MDEAFLNDLLECSVCLEQLDSSSKVLPCQHTFCKRCLQEIVNSHKELRCPECRILVETKIEDLPCNILLVRLLEGIKNNVKPKRVSGTSDTALQGPESSSEQTRLVHPHPQLPQPPCTTPCSVTPGDLRTVPKQVLQPFPCAKALYPYEAKVPGDLTFKKGDLIILRKRVDQNWFYGELGGKSGFVPASFVQVVVPIPTHVPQCKALFDFQISNSEEKDCLTFGKGDILTVIRRIDDHWAEGKLREKIGIFPISFVEMNSAARAIMKLSVNSIQQGPAKILPPPAPSTESHFIAIQSVATTSATGVDSTSSAMCQETLPGVTSSQSVSNTLSPPFSTSTFTSPTHSSSIALQPAVPDSISQNQSVITMYPGTSHDIQKPGPQPFTLGTGHHRQSMSLHQQALQAAAEPKNSDEHMSNESALESNSVGLRSRSTPSPGPAQSSVGAITPPVVSQRAESMGSISASQQGSHIDTVGISSSHMPSVDAATVCHTPAKNASSANHPPTHVPVPTFYLALYTYRPQKEDELELRKGELYTVSEKCQDGWFKGTSLRTGHSGVFPGNYVQLAKSAVLQTHMTSPAGQTAPSTSPPPVHPGSNQPRVISMGSDGSAFHPAVQGVIYTTSPTSLGVRSLTTSPSPISLSHPAVSEWAHSIAAISTPVQRLSRPVNSTGALSPGLYKTEALSKQSSIPCSQSRSLSITPWSSSVDFSSAPSGSTWVTEFPARTTNGSPTRMIPYQGSSSVSIGSLQMASQSSTTADVVGQPRYSISQPSTPLMLPHSLSATTSTNPFVSSAADRMAATPLSVAAGVPCSPSAVVASQSRIDKHKEKKEKEIVSLMKRLTKRKSKSPPPSDYSCDNPTFIDGTSSGQSLATVHVRSTSCPSEALGSQSVNHKKTGSLDGSGNSEVPRSSSRPKQPAPLVRERFRCIVPYPPNGEYELELKIGDIVYVHKKREDGWYKGTLQRTGKTGLFPSSFVEGF